MQTGKQLKDKKIVNRKSQIANRNKLVQRRKEQILAAALPIFARNGFRRTKIDQIADSLSIGKGTIYRYFDDKKDLFLAVYQQAMAELRQRFFENVVPVADPPKKVAAAVKTFFEFFANNPELIEIQMQVRSEFKDEYSRIYKEMYSDYIVRIQQNLRNGIEQGLFRNLDVEKTAEAMAATLQGVLQGFYLRRLSPETIDTNSNAHQGLKNTSAKDGEKLTDRIGPVTDLFLNGLLEQKTGRDITEGKE